MNITKSFSSRVETSTIHPNPLTFFEQVYQAYEQAQVQSSSSIEKYYLIGHLTIRLRFASSALVAYLTPALEHLKTSPVTNPSLTICLWDSVSTKVTMPRPPWQADDYRERGEIRGFNNERFNTIFQVGTNALSLLDKQRNLGIFWMKDPHQMPFWEKGAPLRTILNIWMSEQGLQLTHAGAVGTPDGGVLLVGKGGSGKSTTALSCLNSELGYASDDYCLLASDPIPKVYSIYNTGKKRSNDIQRLPFLLSKISNRDRLNAEKALYFLHEHFPDKILSSFPLKAILIPRVTGKVATTIESASSAAALAALAPSTIFQLPCSGGEVFKSISKIARQVDCFYLNLGTDIPQIPVAIKNLLSSD